MGAPVDLATPDALHGHRLALLRVHVVLRQPHGAQRVQESSALPERAVTRIRLRGVLEKRLEQIRCQGRIGLTPNLLKALLQYTAQPYPGYSAVYWRSALSRFG